jgi:dihydrofolate reductase
MPRRKVIVNLATSADGYIARPDGDVEWLTSRPKPAGLYGMSDFTKSIDTKLLGRKTFEDSVRFGARFDTRTRYVVFSRSAPPTMMPAVEFVAGGIGDFIAGLRREPGKDIWLMGGGDLIASCLDEQVIDEFIITSCRCSSVTEGRSLLVELATSRWI